MNKDLLIALFMIMLILSIVFLFPTLIIWLDTEINNVTYIEYLQSMFSKGITSFKHMWSRLY